MDGSLDSGSLRRPRRAGPLPDRAAEWIRARPVLLRWLLAGPGAVLAGAATMAAMPLWLPAGAAGVNNIALPIILTPLLWAVPFFYAVLAENLVRATAVLSTVTLVQAAAVFLKLV